MKVEFIEDAIRLVPTSPEENTKVGELFTIRNTIKPGTKPKVLVQQLVDQYGCPIENSFFMTIHGDPKKAVVEEETECPEVVSEGVK